MQLGRGVFTSAKKSLVTVTWSNSNQTKLLYEKRPLVLSVFFLDCNFDAFVGYMGTKSKILFMTKNFEEKILTALNTVWNRAQSLCTFGFLQYNESQLFIITLTNCGNANVELFLQNRFGFFSLSRVKIFACRRRFRSRKEPKEKKLQPFFPRSSSLPKKRIGRRGK